MSTATAQPLATGTWKIDTIHSHVGFAVKHMVVSTFRGRFEDYDGASSRARTARRACRDRSTSTRSS